MAVISDIKLNSPADAARSPERLVVLVPEQIENLAEFAHQVYAQALMQGREVVYMGLSGRGAADLTAARMLTTLTALTQGSLVQASLAQARTDCWSDALRQVAQPGDLVICPDEKMISTGSLQPCGALEAELDITVRSVPGIYTAGTAQAVSWMRNIFCWITALAILVGFSFLEFRLAGMINGTLKKVVLAALVLLELVVFNQWDKLFS